MAKNVKFFSEEEKQTFIRDYKNNKSIRQIEKDYGVTRQSLSKFLEEQSIKQEKGNHYRKYFHNFNFFENIDNEIKAYWLGFMYADGYIVDYQDIYGEDQFGIKLNKNDLKSLEDFKIDIESTNPITNTDNNSLRLLMTSQKTCNDLISHGCVKQKSKILKPPKNIPNNLIRHFIRGFFDGDGSIYKHTIRDDYYYCCFTSTEEMCIFLQKELNCGYIYKDNRKDTVYYLKIFKQEDMFKLFNYFYKDSFRFMIRKFNLFQEFLTKYAEKQGINV